MKPKILVVSRGAKFSKNYNTFEAHVSMTVELDEKEDPNIVYSKSAKLVGDMVYEDLKEHILDMKNIVEEEKF